MTYICTNADTEANLARSDMFLQMIWTSWNAKRLDVSTICFSEKGDQLKK